MNRFILIPLSFIIGCNYTPTVTQKGQTVHNHIQSNQQEAKLAQEEYNKIKKQRINT
jgi:hypothetical protein